MKKKKKKKRDRKTEKSQAYPRIDWSTTDCGRVGLPSWVSNVFDHGYWSVGDEWGSTKRPELSRPSMEDWNKADWKPLVLANERGGLGVHFGG